MSINSLGLVLGTKKIVFFLSHVFFVHLFYQEGRLFCLLDFKKLMCVCVCVCVCVCIRVYGMCICKGFQCTLMHNTQFKSQQDNFLTLHITNSSVTVGEH